MIKRTTACLLVVILLAAALTGCDLPFVPQGQSLPPSSDQTEGVPPEQEVPDLPVVLYLPNDNVDGFITKAALTGGSAEHIISLLVDEKALPEGCALNSLTLDGRGGGIADMNAAYGEAVSTTGTVGEYLRLGCVVNTLLTFFDLDELTVTIDGQVPNTGHEVYDYPLRFYENQVAGSGNSQNNSDELNENDLSGAIANLPRSDAAEIIWNRLVGYWTAADNLFVAFVYQNGTRGIEYGIWESEGNGFGEFAGAEPSGEYEAALTFRFPATEATEMNDAREEMTVTVFIDVSGLDQDGKINIKIENHGSGERYTYAYGGATSVEAYQSIH